jgi:predicted enzyme related to lactoylglutathione lyase
LSLCAFAAKLCGTLRLTAFVAKTNRMFKKLRTIIYYVPDLEAAKAWYSRVTGIEPYFDEVFYVGFDINGCELGLHPLEEPYTTGNHTVCHWSVEQIEDCVKKLVEAGATILADTSEVGGGIKVATVLDPWGNAIGLIEGA